MLIIFFFIILLVLLFMYYRRTNYKSHIVSNKQFPEFINVIDNKKLILDELEILKGSDRWSIWSEYDKINETPIFSKMSNDQILEHINKNMTKLNSGKNAWKLFGLILKGKPIESNIKLCPTTYELLKSIPNVINAGFSCFEPMISTLRHQGHNNKILRCHIPLIIPKGDCAIEINNDIIKWKDIEKQKGYFIFDDTFFHKAWNNTNKNRFVLIIDILKR
jgi:hypothetical protein